MSLALRLRREPTLLGRITFGDLYVYNGETEWWQCFTMEDAVRELAGVPVYAWKIKGITAIPTGRFRLGLVDSPKFGPDTLTLLDVPGFEFIRIHTGNIPEDTDGCILVGATRVGPSIGNSRKALEDLKKLVVPELKAGHEVYITVESHLTGAST